MKAKKKDKKFRSLDSHEWHFDGVPKEQKLDCLYYELGRESLSFRNQIEEGKGKPEAEWLKELSYYPEKTQFTDKIRPGDFCLRYWDLLCFFPEKPWLAISPETRSKFSSSQGFLSGNEWPHLSEPFNPITNREISNEHFEIIRELEHGLDPVRFAINWNYSDEAIRKSFASWLKQAKSVFPDIPKERYLKPGILSGQKGRGFRQIDTRLKQLSIMRLLHHMPLKEALFQAKEKRSEIPNQEGSGRNWYRQKAEARKILQEYFSLIPKEEVPISFESFSSDVTDGL